MKKYLKVMLVLVVALSMLCTFALANNPFNIQGDTTSSVNTAINNVGSTVIGVIQTIGYVVAVAMVLVVGIQWLIGTPAKKQELKGKMWNILIGAVLIIAGVSILGLINNFAKDFENDLVGETTSTESGTTSTESGTVN